MRTASTTQQRQSLLDLQRTQERLALNQVRITSGNRITGPGDDPTASASLLDFNNSIQVNTQAIRQADSALLYLRPSEDVVAAAINDVMRLQELSVGGSFASGAELDAIRTNLLSLANTQSAGKYLFAGTNTQVAPFKDGQPVLWQGNQADISLSLNANASVVTNVTGDEVFLGGKGAVPGNPNDIFQAVTDLKTALSNPGNPALLQAASANLDAIFKNLNDVQAKLGGRQAGLTDLQSTLSEFNATLAQLQNTQAATDYPKVATEVAADQLLQSATLSTMAKLGKANLFDYLT